MKIGIISSFIPHKSYGGATHLNDFCLHLIKHNYNVSLISLDFDFICVEKKRKLIKNSIRKQGFTDVKIIKPVKILDKKFKIKIIDYFYQHLIQYKFFKKNSKILEEVTNNIDCDYFIVHADAINFCLFDFKKKMIGWITHDGYPFYKITKLLLKNKNSLSHLINKIDKYIYIIRQKSVIRRFYCSFAFPKFWVFNWKQRLKKNKIICASHPTRHCDINIKDVKKSLNKNNDINILILGSPNVGLTSSSLLFLEKEILPKINITSIKFKVAGLILEETDLIKRLKKKIIFLNYVNNLEKLVYEADIVLLANPFKPSSGSKVATICSMYGCILAHSSLVDSHNEMRDNFNCLTATTGDDFVKKIIFLKNNSKLRFKLKVNARKTYERFYTFERFTTMILQKCL